MSYSDEQYFRDMRCHQEFLRRESVRRIDEVRRVEQSSHLQDLESWKQMERDQSRRKYGW